MATHHKMTTLPIGLAYHVSNLGKSPLEEEAILINVVNDVLPIKQRILKFYSNYHFVSYGNKHGYDRNDVRGLIPEELTYYEPSRTTTLEAFENQSKYAFVLSPHGNGLDCHRTWEAIILGCIPIVKKSKIDVLYQGLPVLIVDEWSDITESLLKKTLDNHKMNTYDYEKMDLKYWMDKINSYKSPMNTENFEGTILDTNWYSCFLFVLSYLINFKNNNVSIKFITF